MNQIFCNLFIRKSNAVTVHLLDEQREWFLLVLYDTVHLLKCIRNNWISEKTTTITFDDITIGYFKDVQDLYKFEKDSILKTTPLQTLQMNGSNAFMTVKDVSASFKKRLRTFSAKILDSFLSWFSSALSCMQENTFWWSWWYKKKSHQVALTDQEYYAVAYVAGWIEMKMWIDRAKDFIMEVSRGALIVPHISTFEFVKCGVCYMKSCRHQVCCKQQLFGILSAMIFFTILVSFWMFSWGALPMSFSVGFISSKRIRRKML